MTTLNKIYPLIAFFILLPILLMAQDSNLGNWYIYIGNKKLDNGWNWHNEVQYRNYNFIGDLEQLLLRTGVGKNLDKGKNNVLLGYGYILSENYIGDTDDKVSVNEHRIFQQFVNKQKFGRLNIQNRYRFEQRWVEGDFRMRFRYFLGLSYPLSREGMIPNSFYLSAYNELFINTKNTIFDRNRLYGGLGYKLNGATRFELGYMNQFFSTSGRDQINIFCFYSF